jgi:hypothetical protein
MTALLTSENRAPSQVRDRGGAAAPLHAIHTDAAAATATAVPRSPLAALLTGQILQDGEVVLLILKPSIWFIAINSLRFAAVVGIALTAAITWDEHLPAHNLLYIEIGLFLVAGRVMVAVLQWMSRLYILTDLRVIRLSGVFSLEIFSCPLRKVARARLLRTVRERFFRVGTIEFIPQDDSCPIGAWQIIGRPQQVHEQVVSTINRAKQGGSLCHV